MGKIITDEKIIDRILSRGVENIYPSRESLKKVLMSGKKLRIYNGIDPTGQLHIGHGVVLSKLRQFQDLGHEVIALIGDFTATIGDPTDKLATRQPLSRQQVLANAKNYQKLIGRILDTTKSNVRFLHNEKWTNKLKPADMLELASYFTVARLLERDMFQARIKAGKEIHLHEFLYPIFQAYDSVTMDVDMEIGGNDQTFNMLAGRDLMRKMKNKEKFVLTTKLLTDPTGKKMGKSEGNMVTLVDAPEQMYGKIMSWTDEMIIPAFEILTGVDFKEKVKQLKAGVNPRDLKMGLAHEVVRIYQGEKAARHAASEFRRVFQEKEKPADMSEVKIADNKIGVLDLFVRAGLAKSNSEVRRLIKEGGIYIDDRKITNDHLVLQLPPAGLLLQRGKKQFVKAVRK